MFIKVMISPTVMQPPPCLSAILKLNACWQHLKALYKIFWEICEKLFHSDYLHLLVDSVCLFSVVLNAHLKNIISSFYNTYKVLGAQFLLQLLPFALSEEDLTHWHWFNEVLKHENEWECLLWERGMFLCFLLIKKEGWIIDSYFNKYSNTFCPCCC